MDTLKAIKTRRSSRNNFASKPIPEEILKELADCGRLAPSGHNKQARCFVVLTEREKIDGVGNITAWGKFMVGKAKACILVFCDKKNSTTLVEDGCAATENILLAATAHGLASCWVAGYGMPYAEEVEKYLNAPENAKLIAIIPLGYLEGDLPAPPNRPSLEDTLKWNGF